MVAVIGLTANINHMEQKERNSNLRQASFQLLIELSEIEEITFHLQYDKNLSTNKARTGWVKVRLVTALTALMPKNIQYQAQLLAASWAANWQQLGNADALGSEQIIQQVTELGDSLIQ